MKKRGGEHGPPLRVFVLDCELGDPSLRVIRAIIEGIDMRSSVGERGVYVRVKGFHLSKAIKAPRHARLVSHDQHAITGLIEQADRLDRR